MPVFARGGRFSPDTPHQAFVNLPNQPLGDWFAAAQVVRHQPKGIPVIQELAIFAQPLEKV